jgi:hypothetical protein
MNYTIITGANDFYILTLIDFINHYISQEFNTSALIIYNLGLNDTNLELVENLNKTLSSPFTIKKFNYKLYREHVNLNKYNGLYCSYAFKPILLFNEAQQSIKPILWTDTANRFNKSIINKIVDIVNKEGIYSPVSAREKTIETIELNHPKTCEILGLTEYEHTTLLKSRSGNIVGFDYKNPTAKNIIDEWYKYSLEREVIMPEGSSRNNHRQDQTILSILMFLYEKDTQCKFEDSTFELSHWHKKDTPTVEKDHYMFSLIEQENVNQLAIIYARSLYEAIKIYCDRKKMSIELFLNMYFVQQI